MFWLGIVIFGVFAICWIGGFISMFRSIYVPKADPWYVKLYAYVLLFFGWPFVLLYMQSRE